MLRDVAARRFVLLCGGAVIATGLAATAPANGVLRVEWVNIANVRDDAGYSPTSSSRANGRAIEIEGQHIAAAWTDDRASDPFTTRDADVELRESFDGGVTWGTLRNLTHSDGKESVLWPDLALSPTATVVVSATTDNPWRSADNLVINRVAPGEQAIDTVLDETAVLPRIASNGGTDFHVVAGSGGASQGYVTYTQSLDDGRTWSAPSDISGLVTNAESYQPFPAVAADASAVAVAWTAVPDGQTRTDVYVASSDDRGDTFSNPVPLAVTPFTESDPAVAMDGDTVVVAWLSFRADDRTPVIVATSIDGGATFGAPEVVATITSEASPCRGCFSPGAFLTVANGIFYLTPRHGDPRILTSFDGTTWSSRAGLVGLARTDIDTIEGEVWAADAGYVLRAVEDVAPGRVATPTVRVDGRKAVIRWVTPRNDGSPLTAYRVTINGNARTVGPGVRRLVLRRLKPGRYRVVVAAVNTAGVGRASDIRRFRIRAS